MRVSRASVFGAFLFALLMLAAAPTVSAQAWLPPKGEAAFSLGWSHTWADHHIDYTGANLAPGDMDWHNAVSDLSYGITDRFAARVNIPFVTSKYVGDRPHPARPGHPPIDTGSWNSAFTDFRAELRFKATTGSLAVTPLVAIVVPSHWYESMGHSSFGNNSVEGQLGVNVGRVLDPLLPNAYLQARYVYAIPEAWAGIRPTRSNVVFDLGYFVTGSLTVSVLGAYTKTHAGWRAVVDFPPATNPDFYNHDRLTRHDYFRFGGGASYALTGSIDVGVNYYATLWARSDINMSGIALSVTYGFSPAQVIKRNKDANR
jgi:hypothetical protein